MYASASHSLFLTWIKVLGGAVVSWLTCWVRSYGSCDMEHAAPGSVLRASRSSSASFGLPDPPAGGRGKDGRIHNDKLRHSTVAQREVASLCLYICCHHFLYISVLCWRDDPKKGVQAPAVHSWHKHRSIWRHRAVVTKRQTRRFEPWVMGMSSNFVSRAGTFLSEPSRGVFL